MMAWLLVPVVLSGVYWTATAVTVWRFMRRRRAPGASWQPTVSLIKPVCGLERDLHANLATACRQDYPEWEVILAVQDPADPALPVLERLQDEYPDRVRIVVDVTRAGPNGRLCNLANATRKARGEVLVFSDSDMRLEPSYLAAVVASLADPAVGVACTLYRAERAGSLVEALELLSLNADFVPSMVFASETRTAMACPGASQAIRRETLDRIGGLEPLADYLAEDLELGRRAARHGLGVVLVPHVAATQVQLTGIRAWWRHQVYWDQNTRAASPVGFFFTWLIRGIPFALAYALAGGPRRWGVLAPTIGLRIGTAAVTSLLLGDREGLRRLWLLPLRDLAGLATWLASFCARSVHWRGRTFELRGNRLVERAQPARPADVPVGGGRPREASGERGRGAAERPGLPVAR